MCAGVGTGVQHAVLAGPAIAVKDGSAFTAYRETLHAYLRGADPESAMERALREAEKAKGWGFFPPPAVLLSQLVEGDEESFNLALADALEAHRDYYGAAGESAEGQVALPPESEKCPPKRRRAGIVVCAIRCRRTGTRLDHFGHVHPRQLRAGQQHRRSSSDDARVGG
ncbi:immunity 49 family protein [Streptomyces sp. ISL-86]|nr:immunity 49 family protein [Streptomyces sp. ISL-86]